VAIASHCNLKAVRRRADYYFNTLGCKDISIALELHDAASCFELISILLICYVWFTCVEIASY